jgi:hypothetical protein
VIPRTGDHALLLDLVHRFTGALLVRGEHRVHRDALASCGDATTADDPWLALGSRTRRNRARRPCGDAG